MKNKDLLLSIIHILFEFLTALIIYFLSKNNLVFIVVGVTLLMLVLELLIAKKGKYNKAIHSIIINFILIKIIYLLINVHYNLIAIINIVVTVLFVLFDLFLHYKDDKQDFKNDDFIE